MAKKLDERLQKAIDLTSEAQSLVEAVRDDMQSEFDDKSESWQQSDKGEEMEARINELTEAADSLDQTQGQIGG